MFLLDENNKAINSDEIGMEADIYFSVLDFKRPKRPDYYWNPLIFLETYNDSSVALDIGGFTVIAPYKWNILTVYTDRVEAIAVKSLIGKDYDAFAYNPRDGFTFSRLPIRVTDVREGNWTCPSLEKTQLLVVPIGSHRNSEGKIRGGPLCVMLGDKDLKIPDVIDTSDLWG